MKQFEELEEKVLLIIEKNRHLQDRNNFLETENKELKSRCGKIEESLMTKDKASQYLESEKLVIKNSIKELLNSISSLEERNKEVIK